MSSMSYDEKTDEDVLKLCTKKCGIIMASEDQQLFSIGCMFCWEKFLYFDAFVSHTQTVHVGFDENGGCENIFGGFGMDKDHSDDGNSIGGLQKGNGTGGTDGEEEDLTDAALLEPQVVMIKEEITDNDQCDNLFPSIESVEGNVDPDAFMFNVKEEEPEYHNNTNMAEDTYEQEPYNLDDYSCDETTNQLLGDEEVANEIDDGTNYDDVVEGSLLSSSTGLAMHIKDRRMIQFLIDCYRRNPFLWDHCHMQFRDRNKRQEFLDGMIMEFKRRFNVSLARDAITRKWDNLRTVYKRECNRMALEKTNVSTLWYFKELSFLKRLYNCNLQNSETVIKENVYRRRYSALWNDISTTKLLEMIESYTCFYDKYDPYYRSKEKRGEALQQMAAELQKTMDVTTIQISKRISQLRFDYSKQKQERLLCERTNKMFVPTYSYYGHMLFMDGDVAPFQCDYCTTILQTPRELDTHLLTHKKSGSGLICGICSQSFMDIAELNRHKQYHTSNDTIASNEFKKYHCDLCTASFREKSNYDEHMRRHNDELFLPSLTTKLRSSTSEKIFSCETCGKGFANQNSLFSHRASHRGERQYKSDHTFNPDVQSFGNNDDFTCNICGKLFKSTKNLQNHKQIHDAVKKYICKICGSAFAQAAGLYLHKRRHNRAHENSRHSRLKTSKYNIYN